VIRTRGPGWNNAQPLEGQDDRRAHADFVNGLVADGSCCWVARWWIRLTCC
jgi:hypothetical protein